MTKKGRHKLPLTLYRVQRKTRNIPTRPRRLFARRPAETAQALVELVDLVAFVLVAEAPSSPALRLVARVELAIVSSPAARASAPRRSCRALAARVEPLGRALRPKAVIRRKSKCRAVTGRYGEGEGAEASGNSACLAGRRRRTHDDSDIRPRRCWPAHAHRGLGGHGRELATSKLPVLPCGYERKDVCHRPRSCRKIFE